MIEEKVQDFLTCKTDAMFKTIFIDEKNPKLLEGLLSCILGGDPHIISWPSTTIPQHLKKKLKLEILL